MPAIAELKLSRRALLTTSLTVSAAAIGACGSESTSPNTDLNKRTPPSPTPEIIIPSLNEPSDKSWAIQKDAAKPAIISGNTVFYNDKDGHAMALEAKTRKQLWKSPETCVLAAADESRLVTIDNQSNIILRAANNFREVKKIPPPMPNLPQDRLKNLYPGGFVLTPASLIVPHKETIMGTKDGFSLYSKSTGERLWGSDGKDHFDFLEAVDGKVIAGSEGFIYILDEKSGEIRGKIPASKHERWIWARQDNLIATVVNSEPDQYKAIEAYVYLWDLQQNKMLTTQRLQLGYLSQTLNRQAIVCVDYCKPINAVYTYPTPPSYGLPADSESYEIVAEVSLGADKTNGPFGYFFMFYDLPETRMRVVKDFRVASSRPVYSAQKDVGILGYGDSSFISYPYLSPPERLGSLPNVKKVFVDLWEPPTTLRPYTEMANTPMLELVDKIGDTIIATSWNKKMGIQADGSLKIFGLAPEKNRSSYAWMWDSGRRDPIEVIPSPSDNSLLVIGESIIKIDAATGKQTQLIGFIGAPPKHVQSKEGSIYIETNDGKLFAFHLN